MVRTQSRRPVDAKPELEATQLESKWDEIRNLMVGIQDGWVPQRQEVHLPQIITQIHARQADPPLLSSPPRVKKNKKAKKWRKKAEANRRKQEEAKEAVFKGDAKGHPAHRRFRGER